MEGVRNIVNANADLVDYLLINKINRFAYDDKVFIRQLPIPRPLINNLIQRKTGHNRSFSKTIYNKSVWLTGSENLGSCRPK